MVFALQTELQFDTIAHRNTVLNAIQTNIITRPRWSIDVLEAGTGENGSPIIHTVLRFTVRPDQEGLFTDINTAIGIGPLVPQPGSWMRLHDCRHDESTSPPACVVLTEKIW